MIDADTLEKVLLTHLPRQRWFAASEEPPRSVEVLSVTPLREGWPALLHVIAAVPTARGGAPTRYQLFLGLRPPEEHEAFLEGKVDSIIGEVETASGPAFAYDAVADPELALHLLHHVAPDLEAHRARLMAVEQSNTSIVFDEHHIMKVFRRLSPGGNPDIEVTTALAAAGFEGVARPLGVWQEDGDDLAVVSEFLAGGSEGFTLAQTSLRDLYDRRLPPGECGADFAPEARRLGIVTAHLHLAMAAAFDSAEPDVSGWAEDMRTQLARTASLDVGLDAERIGALYDRLAALGGAGAGVAIRIHGDYHLGQVMRTDAGWFALDFEGEPDRPVDERRKRSSPLRDVAGMLRSLHYAAEVALRDFGDEADEELADLAQAWEARNSFAFQEGYRAVQGIEALLPAEEASCELVLDAFLLDKAVYEVGYEHAHRPDWVAIPRAAIDRLLEAT